MAQPWQPERVVDPELARRLIRGEMSDVPADSIELLGEGWDNTVYHVDRDWVFRFPRRQLGADLLATEWAILPRIAGRRCRPARRMIRQRHDEEPRQCKLQHHTTGHPPISSVSSFPPFPSSPE